MTNKYRDYFDIDKEYFPQINDSTIEANPGLWTKTYPHETFINMLNSMERVLSRYEKRSLWIHGAYGTGKSQCAFALKKILEVPEEELRKYWYKYDPLRNKPDLLKKLLGHRNQRIVTAYRYASGSINSPRDLFVSIQESVQEALKQQNLYAGENTLKENVIAWIDKPANKKYVNDLLAQPDYSSRFAQSTADEVLEALRNGREVKNLMDNIFYLADKEGITAMNISGDRLLNWLKDVIDKNDIKIVFVWDEFSDYFKNNRESLSEFQKLAELVNLKPFYLVIVTHEYGQLFIDTDATWKKVRDRFIDVGIELPENIAFDLIGHALSVKPAAREQWNRIADSLNSRVSYSRQKVMDAAKIKDQQVIKGIMPLHPMAALLLKNIAAAFKSNQRSMFDFIKSSNVDDAQAFQWFIENTGPHDEHPLLTVDMLWDFFYEKGKHNLDPAIRLILDTYPQQQDLRDDEKAVLKTVLMMQAINQRLGSAIDLFKATDQNLSYAFEGIASGLDVGCKTIANQLVDRGVLIKNPIDRDFKAAVMAGDQAQIDGYRNEIRENKKTESLVVEAGLSTVLTLSPALRLRYEIEQNSGKLTTVTLNDYNRKIRDIRDRPSGWGFHAVIALAKDEVEAASFRREIESAVEDEQYKSIVFIDALSTPLGNEAFEQYVEHSSMAMYYTGKDNRTATEQNIKANDVLKIGWQNQVYAGNFVVYTYDNQEGEKCNEEGVRSVLQSRVIERFPFIFDFKKGVTENQLKLTQAKASAKSGISQQTSGVVVGLEKHVLPSVWNVDDYWASPDTRSLPISQIKVEVDKRIKKSFDSDGQISIGEIYDFLVSEYGFAPCNLSAFLAGFLLKEYAGEPYRYKDSQDNVEPMTPDKLAEMLGNYIGKDKAPNPTYLVKMTPQEKAFHELTEKAWDITPNLCSSVGQVSSAVSAKMRALGLPVWSLAEIGHAAYDVVEKYIKLVQTEGEDTHKIANKIGSLAIAKPGLADDLANLIAPENCQKGMRGFLKSFEGGRVLTLAQSIGAESGVLRDIARLFETEYSCLWERQTGEELIGRLIIEYEIVKRSNHLLNVQANSLKGAFDKWRSKLDFIHVSHEALRSKFPSISKILGTLLSIYGQEIVLPEAQSTFLSEMSNHKNELYQLLNNDRAMFADIYSPYLSEMTDSDIDEVRSRLPKGMFELQSTVCNTKVKETVEDFRRNQLKTQMLSLWNEKTKTKNPRDWSNRYRTPILCCVKDSEFSEAKEAFDTINRSSSVDAEIKRAIEFLEKTEVFDVIASPEKCNELFGRNIVGKYYEWLLPDLEKVRDALERLGSDPYEWYENPNVKSRIKELADAEYNAGGSDEVIQKIDTLDDTKLKDYLRRLVKDNIMIGIEIMADGG